MLGSMLTFYTSSILDKVVPLSRKEFNVFTDELTKLDEHIGADAIVVNCIGAIPQKRFTAAEFQLLNADFPHKLAAYCAERQCRLIHVSTNCVFSGKKDKCSEADAADAEDDYGKSKRDGEPDCGTVLRCSIIGPELVSFTGLMEWFLHNNAAEVKGYTDSLWNGLTTLELSKIICEIVGSSSSSSSSSSSTENRTVHYHSADTVSKYTLLTYFSEIFEKDVTVHPVENGLKYYTLSSHRTTPRKEIREQLLELRSVCESYKQFYASPK